MNKLNLIAFIEQNPDWQEVLTKDPYHLKIKQEGNYFIFNYNQIFSKNSLEIVKESRGIILKIVGNDIKIVCRPFYRFFNYGEINAAEIDWNTAVAQEKVDGSIIKLWYDEKWMVSTNGVIDANKSELANNPLYENYHQLFHVALAFEDDFIGFDNLDKNETQIFEICSPFNKVVIDYPLSLYHLGTKNNITGEERDLDIGIKKPKRYPLHSLEDCIEASKKLPFNEEGYVVVDANYNRIKVKGTAYLIAHRTKGHNTVPTSEELLTLLLTGEEKEFLAYFPEYTEKIQELERKINEIEVLISPILEWSNGKDRKEIAEKIKDFPAKDFIFKKLNGRETDFLDYLRNINPKKGLSLLERMNFTL